jgi:hypothetical protein
MAGRTTELGYDYNHRQIRARLVPLVAKGGWICTRYGHAQFPDCPGEIPAHHPSHASQVWQLGHDDWDKSRYTGPEHKACNQRAGGLKRIGRLLNQNQTQLHW